MMLMFTRFFRLPDRSFFLFGPRGTGKTTWLKLVLPDALWFDMLRIHTVLELNRQPQLFRQKVEARPEGSWIVVDEVQRMPALLNEVHALMADRGDAYRFALSGSSARKLKRLDVNLLAGRAINRQFYPLTGAELEYGFDVDRVLQYGVLPQVNADPKFAVDTLEAYVTNYIREEVQQEAVVKDLGAFSRFLEIAALMNGQVVNMAGIARDAAVVRPTVQGYFQALIDTLIGVWVPAWRRHAKVKEAVSPKFYFFDPGVARALAGRIREPVETMERGFLLETLVLHELRAWMAIHNTGGEIFHWRTPSGSELDFIWLRGRRALGIEVKAGTRWRDEYSRVLVDLNAAGVISDPIGVYLGTAPLKHGAVRILPLKHFQRALAQDDILGSSNGLRSE